MLSDFLKLLGCMVFPAAVLGGIVWLNEWDRATEEKGAVRAVQEVGRVVEWEDVLPVVEADVLEGFDDAYAVQVQNTLPPTF